METHQQVGPGNRGQPQSFNSYVSVPTWRHMPGDGEAPGFSRGREREREREREGREREQGKEKGRESERERERERERSRPIKGQSSVKRSPGSSRVFQTSRTALHSHSVCVLSFSSLLGAKSPGPSPTLEASVQNLELKLCSRATEKCASGTVGAVKVCARTPGVCSCALLNKFTAWREREEGEREDRLESLDSALTSLFFFYPPFLYIHTPFSSFPPPPLHHRLAPLLDQSCSTMRFGPPQLICI